MLFDDVIANLTTDEMAYFWSKVEVNGADECWPWIASRHEKRGGYGQIMFRGKMLRASRVACGLVHGPLGDNMALHSCDNPPCCNPGHTSPGKQVKNMAECKERGRYKNGMVGNGDRVAGTKNGSAKLTELQVQEIRRLSRSGVTGQALTTQFGLSKAAISNIINRKVWAGLKDIEDETQK